MNNLFRVASACLLIFILNTHLHAAISVNERAALEELYITTKGQNWFNNANWNAAIGTECSWYGVTCDADETTITALNLSANNLIGALPLELLSLSNLINTDFRYNAVYSSEQSLIDFLDASGPVGSLLDSQTVDADGLLFSNITNTSLDLSWNPVSYQHAGGYRVYMAQQIDDLSGSIVTDFVEVADIADKMITTTSFTNLTACRQYFFKVVSYTGAHINNTNTIQSDGIGGPITGTIPGYTSSCDLIGSQYDDILNISSGGNIVTEYSVVIDVKDTGERIYNIISPGDAITISSIHTGIENDSLIIDANEAVNISNLSTTGNITINNSDMLISNGNISGDIPVIEGVSISGNIDANGRLIESSLSVTSSPNQPGALTTVETVDTDLGVFEIAENAAIETVVAKIVVHNIFDSPDTTFTIKSGDDIANFSIDNASKDLILSKALDFESKSSYELTIEVDNGNGVAVPYTLSVVVNDVDETNDNSGGGCTLNKNADFDPIFPVMLFIASIYLLRRHFLNVER